MKVKVIASTIIFSLVWTLMALVVILPTIMPKNGERCVKANASAVTATCLPFSYSKLNDIYSLSRDIIDLVSVHTVVGSSAGLMGGLLVSIINKKVNPHL